MQKNTKAGPRPDRLESLLREARAIARELEADAASLEIAGAEEFALAAMRLRRSVIRPLESAPEAHPASPTPEAAPADQSRHCKIVSGASLGKRRRCAPCRAARTSCSKRLRRCRISRTDSRPPTTATPGLLSSTSCVRSRRRCRPRFEPHPTAPTSSPTPRASRAGSVFQSPRFRRWHCAAAARPRSSPSATAHIPRSGSPTRSIRTGLLTDAIPTSASR
jgi:hypothetical protein